MLPSNRRIRRLEIPNILSNGRRYNSQSFLLYILKNVEDKGENQSRFSFSVSKKVSKSAVGRNKLRRRGYSIISRNIKKVKPGFLFLFSFKKGSESKSFSSLENEVIELLSSALVLI